MYSVFVVLAVGVNACWGTETNSTEVTAASVTVRPTVPDLDNLATEWTQYLDGNITDMVSNTTHRTRPVRYTPEEVDYPEYRKYGIYHSLDSIFRVLKSPKYKDMPEVKELIDAFTHDAKLSKITLHRPFYPFIEIEGIQTSGKVTVGRRVADVIGAVYLTSPPDSLYPYRNLFERLNGTLRGLYYSLCNYALANKARRILIRSPVIINRYWHSQAAFALALAETEGLRTPSNSYLYRWPDDLLRPNAFFFLQYSHSRRIEFPGSTRMMTRRFKDRMLQNFMRMKSPLREIYEVLTHRQISKILQLLYLTFPMQFPNLRPREPTQY